MRCHIVNNVKNKCVSSIKVAVWNARNDVMVAILVFQNNETATMLVNQNNPVGVQFFSYVNTFFCSIDLCDVSFN